MGTLSNTIQYVFNSGFVCNYHPSGNCITSPLRHMVIPVGRYNIEIPSVAVQHLRSIGTSADNAQVDFDNIAIPITYLGANTSYATVEPQIKNSIRQHPNYGLVQMRSKYGEVYYCGMGMIFNSHFTPLVTTSWEGIVSYENAVKHISFTKPILRISPMCFNKTDEIQRFIVGKFLSTSFETTVYTRNMDSPYSFLSTENDITIIIEDIPFSIVRPQPPTIGDSPYDLIKVVIDNKEDMLCL